MKVMTAHINDRVIEPLNPMLYILQKLIEKMQSRADQDLVHGLYFECKLILFNAFNLIYLQLIQSKSFVPVLNTHSISSTVQEIIDLFSWKERSRDIWIDVEDKTPADWMLSFDQRSLRVVLFNVITNAMKFQETGRILLIIEAELGIRPGHIMLEITVVDQGLGIDASEVDHVFDLFWKSRSIAH